MIVRITDYDSVLILLSRSEAEEITHSYDLADKYHICDKWMEMMDEIRRLSKQEEEGK